MSARRGGEPSGPDRRGYGREPEGMGRSTAILRLLGWSVNEARTVWRLRRRGLRTQGLVVDNIRSSDPHSSIGPTWAPLIVFTDRAGNRFQFTTKAQGAGLSLSTGSTVDVVYLPEAPQEARVNTWQHLLLPSLVTFTVGLGLTALVVYWVVDVVTGG